MYYHKFGGFKQQKFMLSQPGGQKVKIKVSTGRAKHFQASGGCWPSLACGHVIPISPSTTTPSTLCLSSFLLSVSNLSLPFFSRDTCYWNLTPPSPENPGRSLHLKILNFMCKGLLPNKVTFTDSRD